MIFLSLTALVTSILVLWYLTDITIFLSTIIPRLRTLFRLDEYENFQLENSEELIENPISYPEFLYSQFPSFITKLQSCELCLCAWSNLILLCIYIILTDITLFSGIIYLPISFILSYILYLLIKKNYAN